MRVDYIILTFQTLCYEPSATFCPSNSGNSDDLEWPLRSITYCKPFQKLLFVLLFSRWQHFNCYRASCGFSTTADLLIKWHRH